jgi:hypothetical protein
LVIAAIVFASGCANQSTNTQNASTAVTPTGTPATEVTTAETPATENVTEAPTENMTASSTGNVTANTSVPTVAANGTNLNSVQRHALVAQQQAQQQQSNTSIKATDNESV